MVGNIFPKYLICASSFNNASKKAADMNLALSEWEWHPLAWVSAVVIVYELLEDEK